MSDAGVDFFPTSFTESSSAVPMHRVASMDASMSDSFDDEPPLMDELGIYPDHIWARTKAVLNPMSPASNAHLEDRDVAGPLVFCLVLGLALLLQGKMYLGYIYGIGTMGSLGIYFLMHVMSEHSLDTYQVVSVLGYSLLPICALALISIVIDLHGFFGAFLGVLSVLWCARSATSIFESSLGMQQQRYLIAYPIALFYGAFVIFTIFR